MNSLNLGLSYRAAYESSYGAFKRFLMSNAPLGNSIIKQQLKALHTGRLPADYPALAAQLERAYCDQYAIDFVQASPLPPTAPVRQCEFCARQGYHTHFFQRPWLHLCPLHRAPLTWNCPDCRQPWPNIHQLMNSRCRTCGCLGVLGARCDWSIQEKMGDIFQPFAAMEEAYASLPKICLTSQMPFKLARSYHFCSDVESPCFASLAASLFPQYENYLLQCGIPLEPMEKIEVPIVANHPSLPAAQLNDALERARTDVFHQLKIDTQITEARLNDYSVLDMEYAGIDESTDCSLYALVLWEKIISAQPGVGTSASFHSRYLHLDRLPTYPPIPVVMYYWQLGIEADIFNEGFTHRLPEQSLPLGAQLLVYEIDLYHCFDILLKTFETLKSHRDSSTWVHFERDLPACCKSSEIYRSGLSVFQSSPGTLEFIFPKRLSRGSCVDIVS